MWRWRRARTRAATKPIWLIVEGYALVNATARHQLRPGIAVGANLTNVFGTDYATFGLLGEADDVLGDEYGFAVYQSRLAIGVSGWCVESAIP